MAQDDMAGGLKGLSTKNRPKKTTASRIVPIIPHALERKPPRKLDDLPSNNYGSGSTKLSKPVRENTPPKEVKVEAIQIVAGVQELVTSDNYVSTQPKFAIGNGDEFSTDAETISGPARSLSQEQKELVGEESLIEHVQDMDLNPVEEVPYAPNRSSHIPTSHFAADMPPLSRTEAASLQSQPSSTMSTSIPYGLSSATVFMPQPRINGNDLVFGGYRDSSNSSPIPPIVPGALHSFQVPPNNHLTSGPSSVPFYPAGTDLNVSTTLPPHFSVPSTDVGGNREMYSQVPAHLGHARQFYPMNPRFPQPTRRSDDSSFSSRYPVGPPPRVNDYFPPMSDQPRTPYSGEGMHVDQFGFEAAKIGHQVDGEQDYQRASHQFIPNLQDQNTKMTQYIRSQIGIQEFADYVVHASHSRYLWHLNPLAAHGMILARSPKLRSLMRISHGNFQGHQIHPKILQILCSDKFLSHDHAFFKALTRLYGEPLPDKDFIMKSPIPAGSNPSTAVHQEAMRFTLAYAAAGYFLQIDEIITHALDLAAEIVTWDTVGSALTFALEGGLGPSFMQSEATASNTEDKASNSSYDETPNKFESPASTPAYGIYSERMLHQVVGFLLHNCPLYFQFFASAPQLFDIARLPQIAEPKYQSMPSESKFSQIRFGEMVMQEQLDAPDAATTTMSSVLLSVPFHLLRHILENPVLGERLGWARVADVTRMVGKEREARRKRAVEALNGAVPRNAQEERLWQNARTVESVESMEDTPLRVRLIRHTIGVATPETDVSKSTE